MGASDITASYQLLTYVESISVSFGGSLQVTINHCGMYYSMKQVKIHNLIIEHVWTRTPYVEAFPGQREKRHVIQLVLE